jgi:hypothetical protein
MQEDREGCGIAEYRIVLYQSTKNSIPGLIWPDWSFNWARRVCTFRPSNMRLQSHRDVRRVIVDVSGPDSPACLVEYQT